MKPKILLYVCFFMVIGCGSPKRHLEDKISNKKDFLKGLTELEPQDYDSLSKVGLFGAGTVPFYTEEGELIPISKRMEILSSGDYTTKIYVDEHKTVKLWTVRIMTPEEKKKMYDSTATKQDMEFLDKNAIPFTVKDVKGTEYSTNKLKGKIIVMNFWFLSCYPCVHEIPELNKLVEKFQSKEVVFLAFALDKKEKLEQFLRKKEFKYAVIPDSKSIHDCYGVKACPTQIVIDGEFKIKYHSASSIKPDVENQLEQTINELLAKNKGLNTMK